MVDVDTEVDIEVDVEAGVDVEAEVNVDIWNIHLQVIVWIVKLITEC